MNNIGSFFGKIFKDISQKEKNKEVILEILNKYTNNSLTIKDIKIEKSEVFIKSHPLIKQNILLKKENILEEINSVVSVKITDLR